MDNTDDIVSTARADLCERARSRWWYNNPEFAQFLNSLLLDKEQPVSKKDRYKAGDCLCDMHDGTHYLPDNLQVVYHQRFRTDRATAIVDAIVGRTGNKYLYVCDWQPGFFFAQDNCDLYAVYSYDGRYFGIIALNYV